MTSAPILHALVGPIDQGLASGWEEAWLISAGSNGGLGAAGLRHEADI